MGGERDLTSLLKNVMKKKISRRQFLMASSAGAAALTVPGCSNQLQKVENTVSASSEGKWVSAACWHNCGGRCVNKALVVDGVVVRQKTDDTHPDSPEFPQQRSCLRGRSQRHDVFGVSRLKYPMKRKHWEPGGGDKSLRGRDEWERITWDEALDYVADELKKAKEKYGNNSILSFETFDRSPNTEKVLNAFGGTTTHWDTTSFGTYFFPWKRIGLPRFGSQTVNDRFDMKNSDTIILMGCNPAWSSAGLFSYGFLQAKKAGAEFIVVSPNYNATAAVFDAKWIPVRPGTDVTFLLAVAYTLIVEDDPVTNPLLDWDYIKKYTLGFDADHMPKDAKLNENFKDYVLGKYDGIPKTPEWANKICGAPIEDILYFARKIRKDNKVTMMHAYAPARNIGAEDFPQLFTTIGFMTGHIGKPGHACGNAYKGQSNAGPRLVAAGSNGLPYISNPVDDCINAPLLWKSVLEGEYLFVGGNSVPDGAYLYGGDAEYHPGEKRKIDIRVIYTEGKSSLNGIPSATYGIEAFRHVDFVVTQDFNYTAEAKYADIILPATSMWEKPGDVVNFDREAVIVFSQVTEPLYEAKSDQWIAIELAKRLGLDHKAIFPFDEKQQFFNKIVGTTVISEDGKTYSPLVTITERDISEWGVQGEPQQGKIALQDFIDQGVYQVPRHEGDNYSFIGYEDFIKDPENNPLTSDSGKFDIYSDYKADTLNNTGLSNMVFKPYPSYTVSPECYETTFSDWDNQIKGDYPYVATNTHYLRRTHSTMDNVPWLREAWSNPVYISRHDAEEKGIKTGDTVLIRSAHGKTLRQASVSDIIMPGVIDLPHGRWIDMDEKTGIDKAGTDNIICGTSTSNSGVSGYNNFNCNFEKYDGEQLIPDKLIPPQAAKSR